MTKTIDQDSRAGCGTMHTLVQGYVATTDFDWFTFLRSRRPEEVNFWQRSGRGLHVLRPGEPLFFKLKSPFNVIGRFALFARHEFVAARLAWEAEFAAPRHHHFLRDEEGK